jgi:hypothetical protein
MDETATRTHVGDRELREFLLYLVGALGAMVAVALGVLCGHPLFRSLSRLRWFR